MISIVDKIGDMNVMINIHKEIITQTKDQDLNLNRNQVKKLSQEIGNQVTNAHKIIMY